MSKGGGDTTEICLFCFLVAWYLSQYAEFLSVDEIIFTAFQITQGNMQSTTEITSIKQ